MQKIIIDTNVLVSALIQKNYPYLILKDCVFDSKVEVCISESIMDEYMEVLKRNKFLRFPDFLKSAEDLLADIAGRAKTYHPKIKFEVLKDPADNKFLELAHTSKANFIITGNSNDFTIKTFYNALIVTPREYWEQYKTSR